jgi:hypothetical protein
VAADEHELIALERRGWEALSSDGGGAYYREHLADDAVMAFGFGVLSREQALAAMASAPPGATFESSTFVRRGGTWQLAFHQQTPAG